MYVCDCVFVCINRYKCVFVVCLYVYMYINKNQKKKNLKQKNHTKKYIFN